MNDARSGQHGDGSMPFAREEPGGGGVVDVFIIGAGPAGLTAAYCLTKETPSVLVVEKDPDYVGGICRTIRHDGFLFDIGGHRFFSKSREIVELWHEILPDDPRDHDSPASITRANISLTRFVR
jgi:protoporphyrinogen oxidase